ncbi:RGP1 homolog, RAB6A GEF complex partner 1 L homeolog isoform X1 [Xenopus laevis]|uniref:RGP1 homolog, RAB6A GEF complex partner 1 L homeolog isoform X1 n=1 Tax=Xenopus laevis TaxID=8355 RepID=A0A8J1M2W1_XENLA|nr:RGP1 homolog, RAB6A GEF complex partner 1 L homeolog isoform X1 [Xenopus laevis]
MTACSTSFLAPSMLCSCFLIWPSNFHPNEAETENRTQRRYLQERGLPMLLDYCRMQGARKERVVLANEHWLVVVPYWAVWPFQTLLLPRRHVICLQDLSSEERLETLAWASAQIHCQFHASESRIHLPANQEPRQDVQAENETVFVPNRGERGQCILSTPPKILFCDLRLDPGETKSYSYCESLPLAAPPSFRGQSVKYVYKLTIGCQRVNCPIQLLRVPFRVLLLQALQNFQPTQEDEVAPSNPFLDEEEGGKKDSRLLDSAVEILMTLTSRRTLHQFNISNSQGRVGTFCIFKTVYKIGEDVIGTFSFSDGDIPCLQYSVLLQTEESVQEEYRRSRAQPVTITSHAQHHESCLHSASTSFSLPIPLTSCPGFSTNIVSLKWRLHFEFVTSREPMEAPTVPENQSEIITWTGAGQIEVDTFSWDLPIKVLPTNPLLASYVSPAFSSHCISI